MPCPVTADQGALIGIIPFHPNVQRQMVDPQLQIILGFQVSITVVKQSVPEQMVYASVDLKSGDVLMNIDGQKLLTGKIGVNLVDEISCLLDHVFVVAGTHVAVRQPTGSTKHGEKGLQILSGESFFRKTLFQIVFFKALDIEPFAVFKNLIILRERYGKTFFQKIAAGVSEKMN